MSYRVVCGYPGEYSIQTDDKLRQITMEVLGPYGHMIVEDDRVDDEVLNVWYLLDQDRAKDLKQALLHAGIEGLNVRIEDPQEEIES